MDGVGVPVHREQGVGPYATEDLRRGLLGTFGETALPCSRALGRQAQRRFSPLRMLSDKHSGAIGRIRHKDINLINNDWAKI